MFRASRFFIVHEMARTCKVKVTRTSVITHLIRRIGEEDEGKRHSLLSRSCQGWRELELPVLPFPIISCDQASSSPFKNYFCVRNHFNYHFQPSSGLMRVSGATFTQYCPPVAAEGIEPPRWFRRSCLINSLDDVMTGKRSSPVPTLIHLFYYPAKSQQSQLQNLQGSTLSGWIRFEFEFPPDTKLFNEPFYAISELQELRLKVFSAAAC